MVKEHSENQVAIVANTEEMVDLAAQFSEAWEAEFGWIKSTKEKLSPQEVLYGLLDHGLFGEKVPPCFGSAGLAAAVEFTIGRNLNWTDKQTLDEAVKAASHDYIRYDALRDINIPRQMGIPHPESYGMQALAIAKHWKEIALHCNRPSPAVSRIHVRHAPNDRIFEMSYEGSDKYGFEEDQIRWMSGAQYLVQADIASCFPSTYTHVIPWALHGRSAVKNDHDQVKYAGNLLDNATQSARDRQTNGILIGPHASNIISEIILTKVDLELQEAGYRNFVRFVDDYSFYARTYEEGERFIQALGLRLRAYELSLNEKKTRITPLPRPSKDDWYLALSRFVFPKNETIGFSTVRSYLDLALEYSQHAGKSSPLNYAIKVLSGKRERLEEPTGDAPSAEGSNDTEENWKAPSITLNTRARRMYTQEAMNLALSYPYLAPLLDEYVFERHTHDGLLEQMTAYASDLIRLGIRKLYPDAICHSIYLALKYEFYFQLKEGQKVSDLENELIGAVALNDCMANVLLLEYAKKVDLKKLKSAVIRKANDLKTADRREQDTQWLLIYQVWPVATLKGCGQKFLGELKDKGFRFFSMPIKAPEQPTAIDGVEPGAQATPQVGGAL